MSSPSTRGGFWLLGALAVLLAAAVGFGLGRLGAAQAPLGEPLPEIPRIFEVEGVEPPDTSINEGRVPEVWLEFLAPQPDGVPPLRYSFHSDVADFTIRHPMGAQTVVFSGEEVLEDAVLAQVVIKLDQPLSVIKYAIPFRRAEESVTEYVARLRRDLERKGAVFYGGRAPLELAAYRFEHIEYRREAEGQGILSHHIYLGPYGPRVLIIDFICTPSMHERARPYVEKIMGSFEPGWELKRQMLREDPEYGELAGTPLAERESPL